VFGLGHGNPDVLAAMTEPGNEAIVEMLALASDDFLIEIGAA
jgi:hypothetical protein